MKTDTPEKNTALSASLASPEVLSFLSCRRSTLAKLMIEPGPSADELDTILEVSARVPDHRKLAPWRFLVFEGDARKEIGEHIANKFMMDCPDVEKTRVDFERERFLRAPLVVGVVSSPVECPRGTPIWEQELSAGAVCMNMLHSANASGFAAQWLTEWYAFDDDVKKALGLDEQERMAGFIYIGSCDSPLSERTRPNMADIVTKWSNLA